MYLQVQLQYLLDATAEKVQYITVSLELPENADICIIKI